MVEQWFANQEIPGLKPCWCTGAVRWDIDPHCKVLQRELWAVGPLHVVTYLHVHVQGYTCSLISSWIERGGGREREREREKGLKRDKTQFHKSRAEPLRACFRLYCQDQLQERNRTSSLSSLTIHTLLRTTTEKALRLRSATIGCTRPTDSIPLIVSLNINLCVFICASLWRSIACTCTCRSCSHRCPNAIHLWCISSS